MKRRSRFLVSFGLALTLCWTIDASFGQGQKGETRKYTLGNTEYQEIASKITQEHYELIVALPYTYAQDTAKRYPVVYFCDGFYDFPLFWMIYADQIYDKTISECILVGFSYKGEHLDYGKLRTRDYTPISSGPGTGGGPEFLKVVEREFIPFVEKHYRVDPGFRALGGSSLGGLFVLYTMFSRPELFNAYMAVSPAVVGGNGWLFNLEEQFHSQHKALPVSLYMTGAEKEFADQPAFFEGIKFFGEVLKKRDYERFRYQFRVLDGAYHAGSKPEGFSRAMQFIFAPLVTK